MVEWGSRLTKPFIYCCVFFTVPCYAVRYFAVWLLVTVAAVQTLKESAGLGDRLNCSLPSRHP